MIAAIGVQMLGAQGRPLDWTNFAGDAQRTGWRKQDLRITRENVKDLQLVLKRKFDNAGAGPHSLTPPVVIGNLISYKGFKELGFVTGAPDSMWSIDVDLDRMFWQKKFPGTPKASGACAAVATAVPSLTPPRNFAARPRSRSDVPLEGILAKDGAYGHQPAFAVSSDGKLHVLNTSTGEDLVKPVPFLPAGSKASNLAIVDGFIYTTTTAACGGTAGVWAIDLSTIDPDKPGSLPKVWSRKGGVGGLAFGTDNTVYVQTDAGDLLALDPKDLHVTNTHAGLGATATPVVFQDKDRDVVVASGARGQLTLLDSKLTVMAQTPPLVTSGRGVWGGLATWADPAGARWILAPVWGAPKAGVVAFELEEKDGKPALTQRWMKEMSAPEIPVIASGIVFALSAGEYASDDAQGAGHAVLFGLDGTTGKELYSTANQVAAPANLNGVTVANGRVYFATTDNTLYAFGIFLER
ncbi:MAG: PQQ-binding-like beta-propeller repeat protein [Bryobacteraceae bacterium]